MNTKYITRILVAVALLIGSTGFAFAQTFTEPSTTPNLPPPLATTDKSQSIQGGLQVGVNALSPTIANVALYVQGGLISKNGYQNGVTRYPDVSVSNNVFRVHGSTSQVLFGTNTCTKSDAQACAQSTTGAAVYALHPTGQAIVGQTSGSNAAGVYGESPNFGILAQADTFDSIPLQVSSCTEVQGAPGTCATFGQAGYFVGDVKIEGDNPSETGFWTGDGNRVYRVQSLYNKQEGSTPTSKGVAYVSVGYPTSRTIGTFSSTITGQIPAGAQVVSLYAVESSDNINFTPAGNDLVITYSDSSASFTVTNNAHVTRYLRMIVGYLQ